MPVTDPFFLPYPQSYYSKHARGSMLEETRGVGRATTHAVVSAAILIFAADYLLTAAFTHK